MSVLLSPLSCPAAMNHDPPPPPGSAGCCHCRHHDARGDVGFASCLSASSAATPRVRGGRRIVMASSAGENGWPEHSSPLLLPSMTLRGGGETMADSSEAKDREEEGEEEKHGGGEEGEDEGMMFDVGNCQDYIADVRKRWVSFAYQASRRRMVPRDTMDEVLAAAATGDAAVIDAERLVARALDANGGGGKKRGKQASEEAEQLFAGLLEVIVACAMYGAEEEVGDAEAFVVDAERAMQWMEAVGMQPGAGAFKLLLDVGRWAAVRGGAAPDLVYRSMWMMKEGEIEVSAEHYESAMGVLAASALHRKAGLGDLRRLLSEMADAGIRATRCMLSSRLRMVHACAMSARSGGAAAGGGAEGRELVREAVAACEAFEELEEEEEEDPAGDDEYGLCLDVIRAVASTGHANLADAVRVVSSSTARGTQPKLSTFNMLLSVSAACAAGGTGGAEDGEQVFMWMDQARVKPDRESHRLWTRCLAASIRCVPFTVTLATLTLPCDPHDPEGHTWCPLRGTHLVSRPRGLDPKP